MNFILFLHILLQIGATPLQRSQRDLVSWNKLSNMSARLRLVHSGERVRQQHKKKHHKVQKTLLERYKAYLAAYLKPSTPLVVIPEVTEITQ